MIQMSKKRKTVTLISIIAALLAVALCVTLCVLNMTREKEPDNLIYNSKTELQIVIQDGVISSVADSLWKKIGDATGIYPDIVYDAAQASDHEIILGKTNRPASVRAYELLGELEREDDGDSGIVIYSDGSSLAVAYDEDKKDVALRSAIALIESNYVKAELTVDEGIVHSESFDYLDRLAEWESIERELAWEVFETKLSKNGEAITEAYKSFYKLYSFDMMEWVANLYDPDICVCRELYGLDECTGEYVLCGTAGFHYTPSARDTVGFLPVAEAMHSIMNLVVDVGLTDSYKSYFPEEIKDKMARFIYNLQDPDGYFYHPQWGKDIGTGRRGRDLDWCTTLLAAFGLNPKYATIKGVSYFSDGGITSRFGQSAAVAVSRAAFADSEMYIPPNLVDLDAFKAYLAKQKINTKSYSVGSSLASQMSQIKARQKATKEPFCETLGQWLDDHQLDNGLWHAEADYFGVNGLMKISGVYSSLKRAIPNVDKSIQAALAAITSDENPTGIVDVWNPWSALSSCLGNMRKYRSSEEAAEIRRNMLDGMDEAIAASEKKLMLFRKSDGSFSYHQNRSTSSMQGAPCAVYGVNEGDMDGVALAVFMIDSINSVLGMGKYKVSVFGEAEAVRFLNIIENAEPVEKIAR